MRKVLKGGRFWLAAQLLSPPNMFHASTPYCRSTSVLMEKNAPYLGPRHTGTLLHWPVVSSPTPCLPESHCDNHDGLSSPMELRIKSTPTPLSRLHSVKRVSEIRCIFCKLFSLRQNVTIAQNLGSDLLMPLSWTFRVPCSSRWTTETIAYSFGWSNCLLPVICEIALYRMQFLASVLNTSSTVNFTER